MATENILIFGSIALLILIAIIAYFVFQLFRLKKRVDIFFTNGDKNLEEVLKKQIKGLERQGKDIARISNEISELDKISKISFQKIGIVRYNPFRDVGSDQSFSMALLDLNNDGFVITSLYGRDGNRVYAKPVNKGKSKYSLSEEEKEALEKAKKPKNNNK